MVSKSTLQSAGYFVVGVRDARDTQRISTQRAAIAYMRSTVFWIHFTAVSNGFQLQNEISKLSLEKLQTLLKLTDTNGGRGHWSRSEWQAPLIDDDNVDDDDDDDDEEEEEEEWGDKKDNYDDDDYDNADDEEKEEEESDEKDNYENNVNKEGE
ncbi:hypothetical protein PoB_004611100 [Plakobranchus ocellatus]|uniref:Uncharacterized protein n=1 Tax=Plakobranchus ocellatus TaxID=259542 RepID=A0AAV4BKU1_9GAST|nr:hypothetical protein PoB_004611100 [Plakobranchus ocellatus]